MSSWVSHLPPEATYRRVVGLGMNEAELRANARLDAYVVQDLNREPRLPFADGEFDGAGHLRLHPVPHRGRRRCCARWGGCWHPAPRW